jgi:hypothetical protein
MKEVLFKVARMLRRWSPMMQQDVWARIEEVIIQLELKASRPPLLMWSSPGGIIVKVGTIGCSTFGLQRCNE